MGVCPQVLLPHEGARRRLYAWRDRAALKDFADAAAAGDDPAAALPAAAGGQEEAGDDDEAAANQAEGATAVADQPLDWHREVPEGDSEIPDFSRWGMEGRRTSTGG